MEGKINHYTQVHKFISIIQRKSDGKNIGMRAAELGLEEVVLDIIDKSEEACTQVDNDGRNIGIYSARSNLKTATLLSLQNTEVRIQRDKYGKNIEDYQYSYFKDKEFWLRQELKPLYNEIVEDIKKLDADNYNGNDKRRIILEQKIINKIKQDERVLTYQNENGENLGMRAAHAKLENLVLYTLENGEASVQQNNHGLNIGMYSAIAELPKATLKALDNKVASMQQSEYGNNIGMFACEHDMEDAVIVALDNPIASIQVNFYYQNIGIIAAQRGMKDATIKALKNKSACKQETSRGKTIYDYTKQLFDDNETEMTDTIDSQDMEN